MTRTRTRAAVTRPTNSVGSATRKATSKAEALGTGLPNVTIPTEMNEPPGQLNAYKILIYAEKAWGKTSLCSSAPGSFTLQCDPLRRNVKLRQVPIEPSSIESIKEGQPDPFKLCLAYMAKAAADDSVQSLHIDNFQRFYDAALNSFCAINHIDDPKELSNESWGAGWRKLKAYYQSPILAWTETGKGLTVTAHGDYHEIDPNDGTSKYKVFGPSLSSSVFEFIKEVCDFCFCGSYDQMGKRRLILRNNGYVWAACGTAEHFNAPDGTPVTMLPMGSNGAESWKILQASFDNQVYDYAVSETPKFADETKPKQEVKRQRK